jgi:1,4-dihydroxy-2-naphthoate octaprenyltransferase
MTNPTVAADSIEPWPERLPWLWQRYWAAVRPGFLLVSVGGAALGLAAAALQGPVDRMLALLSLLGAAAAHAGINVLNDYYDHLNGGDAANTQRLYPFSGGSRVIQNGVLSTRHMLGFGSGLLAAVALLGLALMAWCGAALWWVGLGGLLLGWAYSAPPLWLAARGLGELAVGLGFGVLLPMGAYFVQRGAYGTAPLAVGLPYALLVANVLLLNQFPDAAADAACGKRTLVLRLGKESAGTLYWLLALLAAGLLPAGVALDLLPPAALWALPAVLPALPAWRRLRANSGGGSALLHAIRLTLAAALAYAALLTAALLWQA